MTTLFDPIHFGNIAAANRIVMAPMSRNRAGPGQVPTPLMATYYGQRATAGLIVSEATQISPEGRGHLDTPGIYSAEQKSGWRRVTDSVHAKGGKIVLQLWHMGRIWPASLQQYGHPPVFRTEGLADRRTFTVENSNVVTEPLALRLDELQRIVAEYRQAARNAIDAGFDGVEVHCANGHLLDQFLRHSTNPRPDIYGGPKENRVRLPIEVIDAIVAEIGADHIGLRLSPVTPVNFVKQDGDAQGLFNYFVEQIAPLKLAFIHIIEGATGGPRDVAPFDYAALRRRFKIGNEHGAWIVNNGYTRAMAIDAVASGAADMVAFGKSFISNPDLVSRLRLNAPLATPNSDFLHRGGAVGYIDYPTLKVPKIV